MPKVFEVPQPTTYTRKANFAEYQASAPTAPLVGARVDEEFNALKITLDEVLANLRMIQRDDGEVANLTIGREQLKTQLLLGIDPAVEWKPETAYIQGNTVVFSDIPNSRAELWLVNESHTSTDDFDADSVLYMTQLADLTLSNSSAGSISFAPGSSGLSTNLNQAVLGVNDKVTALETKTGGVQFFDTFAEITASTVLESGVTQVHTGGYNSLDDGGAGRYKVVGTLPAHQYDRFYKQIGGGQYLDFMVPADGGFVTEKHAGGVGDGATDDWDAVQQTFFWANHPDRANLSTRSIEIRLIGPLINFSRPLLVTTGKFFTGVVKISGPRTKNGGDANFGGVALRPTFANGVPLVIHGGRDVEVEGIAFYSEKTGANARNYEAAVNFDILNVIDTSVWDGVGVGTQHAPECFVAVDPFGGSAPADVYGLSPTLPSWDTGALYGRLQTSRVTFRNCHFENRETAVVLQPGDFNANADFVRFEHCRFFAIKYAQSIGNSQARSGEFENCEFNTVKFAATTKRHGRQIGRLDMHIINCSGALMEGWIETHDTATGVLNTVIERSYIESGWILADIGSEGLYPSTLEIVGCTLNVKNGIDSSPGPLIRGTTSAMVTIRNTAIGGGLPNCAVFEPPNVFCDGVYVAAELIQSTGLTEKEYQRIAASASCGLYPDFTSARSMPEEWRVRTIPFDEDTDNLETSVAWTDPRKNPFTTRDCLMPIHQSRYTPRSQPDGEILTRRYPGVQRYTVVAASPGATECTATISDRTLTLSMGSNFTDANAFIKGGLPGDAIMDANTKTVWWIRSRTGTTVIAEQQTNYTPDGGGGYTHSDRALSLTGSQLVFLNQRQFVPGRLFFGDFSTGSANITYYQGRKSAADNGTLNNVSTGFQVGDYLFIDPEQDGMHIGTECEITAINSTPGVMTVTGAAARVDRTRFVLTGIKQPPANEASR